MPATSRAQQKLFAVALHHPGSLSAKNRALAMLPMKTLRDFASTATKRLPTHIKRSR